MGKLTLKSGDTETIKLLVTDTTDAAEDITGYTSLQFKIAQSLGTTNAGAVYHTTVLAANFSHGSLGYHNLEIAEDTTKDWTPGEYIFQARVIDGSNVVTSNDTGPVTIEENLMDDET